MKRFKDILCVVEAGKLSKPALDRAVTLAENNQANLTIVGIVKRVTAGIGMPDGGPISADLQAAMVKEHAQKLDALVEPYRKRQKIETKTLVGTPFLQVVREVLRHEHDLVIKIPEHQDWLDRLLGSDDMHLLRKCPCPVWLIKPQAPKSYNRILAAVDVDEDPFMEKDARYVLNKQILEMASSLALADSAELHIVHVWEAVGESAMRGAFMHTPEEKITAYVEDVRRQHVENLDLLLHDAADKGSREALNYLNPRRHIVKGRARKEIPALARRIEADLIVMGTVARTGIPGLLMGNTAETILNQIDCSVLAIKPSGFVTPVTLDE